MATKARQQYFADESSLQKQSREFSIADDLQQKIDGIEEGAQVNVIETVKVNGVALVPDVDKAVDVSVPEVIDSLNSTSIDDALSARQGKVLYDYIQNIGARGRFLSNRDCATGLPMTDPEESPYPYKAGDYYSVSNVATSPATNYRPDGTQYVARQASTTVETETVGISDFYLYDGTTWLHLANSGRTIAIDSSLSTTSTNPVENRVITNALNSKQNILTGGAGIDITNDTVNARVGTGLTIGNYQDYSAIKGPCPEGFHLPMRSELVSIKSIWTTLGGGSSDGGSFCIALKLPFAGMRSTSNGNVASPGALGRYWSCSASDSIEISGNEMMLLQSTISCPNACVVATGLSIRAFKNIPIIPDSNRIILYDGSSISTNAGIFWNKQLGLISLSSDGNTWITISDKNLGATEVWNNGDTLSEANCGKFYQRGNNYGFPWSGSITTSSTQVDATNYGPGNYYESSTFITSGSNNRSTVRNDNLRGGQIGVVTQTNTILNTGVLSVNGQTGDVTIPTAEEGNTKTFYLSNTSDLVNAQAALDWYLAGKEPIIVYGQAGYSSYGYYYLEKVYSSSIGFRCDTSVVYNNGNSNSFLGYTNLNIEFSNGTVTRILSNSYSGEFLSTNHQNNTSWSPTQDYHPATKKYVDDNIVTYSAGDNISIDANNEISAIDTTYTAGIGIEIGDINNYSAMRGPAPEGYHIPSKDEWVNLCGILTNIFSFASNGETMKNYLLMPFAGFRYRTNGGIIISQGTTACYWSSTAYGSDDSYYLSFNSSGLNPQDGFTRSYGYSIRCFKDIATIPDTSWITLYDGSGIITGAGIFRNASLGLISISGDGVNRTTIADKNLGATTAYNNGDTLSETNCGGYFQWGNNYMFSWTGTLTDISSTLVDASTYGPGNYYSSSTYITRASGPYRWDSTNNLNLWGGETGVVTLNNAITNTGVLSVNGQTGDVIITAPGDSDVKVFKFPSGTPELPTSGLVTDQDTIDILNDMVNYLKDNEGDIPVLSYEGVENNPLYCTHFYYDENNNQGDFVLYSLWSFTPNNLGRAYSIAYDISGATGNYQFTVLSQIFRNYTIAPSGGIVNNQAQLSVDTSIISTKQYVDDKTPIVSATAPSSPVEGMIWYDTTNDILKTYDGTDWNVTSNFPGMTVLSYGHNTWQDFLDAYNKNAIVYCRASSQSNPGSGNQTRMAFMAFVDINATTGVIQGVEFQYYRSRSDHNSAANQLDEVYVYKLVPASGGTWSVTQRNTGAKAVAGTGISLGWGSGNMTISNTAPVPTGGTDGQVLSKVGGNVAWANPLEYNAGKGISIGDDYSAMRGPCEEGFHIPSRNEREAVIDAGNVLGVYNRGSSTSTYTDSNALRYYYKIPRIFQISGSGEIISADRFSHVFYMTCESKGSCGLIHSNGYIYSPVQTTVGGYSCPIRPFKDTPVIPDNTWTMAYDGSSVATGAGIFWNNTLGLISVSKDGITWYTIADKDIGATNAYSNSSGGIQSDAIGYVFQWGNNYGFQSTGITTSVTQVDASGYGPGNYYSSDTYITTSWWDTSDNANLWGGVTGIVSNAISVTGEGLIANNTTGTTTTVTSIWAGTQAEYNALQTHNPNTIYHIY